MFTHTFVRLLHEDSLTPFFNGREIRDSLNCPLFRLRVQCSPTSRRRSVPLLKTGDPRERHSKINAIYAAIHALFAPNFPSFKAPIAPFQDKIPLPPWLGIATRVSKI